MAPMVTASKQTKEWKTNGTIAANAEPMPMTAATQYQRKFERKREEVLQRNNEKLGRRTPVSMPSNPGA